MQHIWWGFDHTHCVAPIGDQMCQIGDTVHVRSSRCADQNLTLGHQNVAAFDMTGGNFADVRIERHQGPGDGGDFTLPGRCAGMHQDRTLWQAKCGVLDKDRIGQAGLCRKLDDPRAGLTKC